MAQAKFVTGSIMRHIWVMSSTSAVGISALFVVDLLDMFFLSLLGHQELAAAVGYAGTISFFTTSIGIGLSIALGAVVSRAIGQRDMVAAKRLLMSAAVVTVVVAILVSVIVTLNIPTLLDWVGASGETKTLAAKYLYILVPSLPFICLAMALGAALRAVGDARLSMLSTLAGGGVNAVLDPIFIFLLAMGIEGAAVASVLARLAVMLVAGRGVIIKHRLLGRLDWPGFKADLRPVLAIAVPAMLTNIATPIGNGVVTRAIAEFGDAYVAGWAVVGRVIPVAFGMIFALSGAIGPIIGQNFGAREFGRVRETLTRAIQFCIGYVLLVSLLLLVCRQPLVAAFDLSGKSADIAHFFLTFIAVSFIFNGILFVANASFNNLGKAKYSTFFNVGKALLGTIPFVYVGGLLGGAHGVLVGQALGSVVFGVAGVMVAYRLVEKVRMQHQFQVDEATSIPVGRVAVSGKDPLEDEADFEELSPVAASPLSSSCAQMAQLAEEQDLSDCEAAERRKQAQLDTNN